MERGIWLRFRRKRLTFKHTEPSGGCGLVSVVQLNFLVSKLMLFSTILQRNGSDLACLEILKILVFFFQLDKLKQSSSVQVKF